MTVSEKAVSVAPFGVIADHPRNCDMVIQSIPGCRLRSTLSANKPIVDSKTGETRIPLDQARHFSMLPTIPGMELHVNPSKLTYTVVDPLYDDEDMCDRILKVLNRQGGVKLEKVRGAEPRKGQLDVHRMKTLCREILHWKAEGAFKIAKGMFPSMEDIEELPGDFLLNPGSVVHNTQPQFEKDWDDWIAKLNSSGG